MKFVILTKFVSGWHYKVDSEILSWFFSVDSNHAQVSSYKKFIKNFRNKAQQTFFMIPLKQIRRNIRKILGTLVTSLTVDLLKNYIIKMFSLIFIGFFFLLFARECDCLKFHAIAS